MLSVVVHLVSNHITEVAMWIAEKCIHEHAFNPD